MNKHQPFTGRELIRAVYVTQIILIIISIFLGFILFNSFSDFALLLQINADIFITGLITGAAIVLIDLLLMKVFPEQSFDDGGINRTLFSYIRPAHILLLTGLIAFSEELLFRGVLQTHIGLIGASMIFIAIHFRYLKNLVLLVNITCLSFILGFVYEYTESLWSVFTIHFIIDYILGIYIHYTYKEGD
ncbi:CAAX amino terminal protease family protein [Jeotgalibacillus alimentarius]|uniref:CAAX amino terminal protease family protein n=1 Tax=Jeotgalibacillus alimentarius TaxID=135826 RepID=A0A0C2VX37_9BACL|nr:CPBP family intramembrane glutamic endopeptidase [Jeotgalibacillus alimentarius]KIL48961.1 CAAX amino terminal protease family protein [Jeotgalibacillus alimentarius]